VGFEAQDAPSAAEHKPGGHLQYLVAPPVGAGQQEVRTEAKSLHPAKQVLS
jgi:hypothetical protein